MASGGQWVDSTIQYHVSILPDAVALGCVIDGNSLYTTGVAAINTTGGIASISENLYSQYPGPDASSFADEGVYYMSPTNKQTLYTNTFAPVTDLWVVKDISVSGGSGPGVMHMSEFYQTFHQTPEPSTLVLSTVGMLGLAAFAWRKRRSA